MKELLFALLIFLSGFIVYGQKQNNHWYFGSNAGIDFNSGVAVSDTNGQLQSFEACSSISDSTGNLLFYTNGSSFTGLGFSGGVWNKNHQLMPNGILNETTSCNSTTRGALIVPDPRSEFEYYIFTLDCFENGLDSGLWYHKVDMNLDGGDGDVTEKEVPVLVTPLQENILAVKHPNDSAYWIIVHEYSTTNFRVLYLDAFGIVDSLTIPLGPSTGAGGTMVMNSTNDLFINASNWCVLYDFDNLTGQISNPNNLGVGASGNCAISPNDSVLYSISNGALNQFDLFSTNIAGSLTPISSVSGSLTGVMGTAPDGKIYISKAYSETIHVIDNPNSLGIQCNFISDGFDLNGKTSRYGLPNFAYGYLSNWCNSYDTLNVEICNSSYESPSGNYVWMNSGQYKDTLITVNGCDSIFTINLTVNNLNSSVVQNGFVLESTINNAQYQWVDCSDIVTPIFGETNQSYTITANGHYAVITTINGCSDTSDCIIIENVGINEFPENSTIFVSPNPISNFSTLFLKKMEDQVTLNIYDCMGREVESITKFNIDHFDFRIEGASGIFFLEVLTSDNKGYHLKVLKE